MRIRWIRIRIRIRNIASCLTKPLSADGKNRVLFYCSLGSEAGDWHGLSVCLVIGESVHDL